MEKGVCMFLNQGLVSDDSDATTHYVLGRVLDLVRNIGKRQEVS